MPSNTNNNLDQQISELEAKIAKNNDWFHVNDGRTDIDDEELRQRRLLAKNLAEEMKLLRDMPTGYFDQNNPELRKKTSDISDNTVEKSVHYQEVVVRPHIPIAHTPVRFDDKDYIRKEVHQRGIKHLFHFTPWANIDSIWRNGLLSRQSLYEKDIDFRPTDNRRNDGYLNRISVSISFPNYRMFYQKRENSRIENWAVFLLKPDILWTNNCLFCNINAADADVKLGGSFKDFRELFDPEKRYINGDQFTSNPQAEVLVLGKIPREKIAKIVVQNNSHLQKLRGTVPDEFLSMEKIYFRPRDDYEYFQNTTN